MYRNILINNPARIYQKNHQLVVEVEAIHRFPIEDIATLVIDNQQTSITTNCLNMLAEQGVCVIVCDGKHMPSGCLMPVSAYSRRLPMLKLQLSLPKVKIKHLWQQIIKQKIANQGKCLELIGHEDNVSILTARVKSGDTDNVEGVAAARYFKNMFGDMFARDDDIPINGLLNYGYAIIRAYIARQISAYGLETSVGLFHHSELNNFNLADDIIEPFRPVVDLQVASIGEGEELNPQNKSQLIGVLSHDVSLNGEKQPVSYAIEKVVQNLIRCFKGEADTLILPKLLPIEVHRYE
ncbi:MAG: type II CRISPR-associated endonuclease Cas1 [Selenomonadaceae bacterium]|nr:type II CRISPR-associated endonuclease Cas1 [Selenomonadaceae bacterium]